MSIQTCSRPCSRARRHVSTTFLNPFSVSAQPALQILQGDLIVAPNVREDGVAWDILTKNGPQLHCHHVDEAHVGRRVVIKRRLQTDGGCTSSSVCGPDSNPAPMMSQFPVAVVSRDCCSPGTVSVEQRGGSAYFSWHQQRSHNTSIVLCWTKPRDICITLQLDVET